VQSEILQTLYSMKTEVECVGYIFIIVSGDDMQGISKLNEFMSLVSCEE